MRIFKDPSETCARGYHFKCMDCPKKQWFEAPDLHYAQGLARLAGWSHTKRLGWLCKNCILEYKLSHPMTRIAAQHKLRQPITSYDLANSPNRKRRQIKEHTVKSVAEIIYGSSQ